MWLKGTLDHAGGDTRRKSDSVPRFGILTFHVALRQDPRPTSRMDGTAGISRRDQCRCTRGRVSDSLFQPSRSRSALSASHASRFPVGSYDSDAYTLTFNRSGAFRYMKGDQLMVGGGTPSTTAICRSPTRRGSMRVLDLTGTRAPIAGSWRGARCGSPPSMIGARIAFADWLIRRGNRIGPTRRQGGEQPAYRRSRGRTCFRSLDIGDPVSAIVGGSGYCSRKARPRRG